jgi:uncharacterized membrane protein
MTDYIFASRVFNSNLPSNSSTTPFYNKFDRFFPAFCLSTSSEASLLQLSTTTISNRSSHCASILSRDCARAMNFTRFYAIALLFISHCFARGGKAFLEIIRSFWIKINKTLKRHPNFIEKMHMHTKATPLLLATILSAYFLSESGFINYVTGGAIHSQTFDYHRMKTSNDPRVNIYFYGTFIPEQDAFSAYWLSKYVCYSSIVYSDLTSRYHVLISCALIPADLIHPLTNITKPMQGSFIYLDSLNVVSGIIPASDGIFHISEISVSLDKSNLIYSNGNSEVWTT